MAGVILVGEMIARWEVNASHKRKIKRRRAINEIMEPIDEITFHDVYESG